MARSSNRLFMVLLILAAMAGVGYLSLRERALPEADFKYSIGDSIKTLDPARMAWSDEILIGLALWEGLASYHPQTTVPIDGAARIPPQISADGITYTFELRPEAHWSNGDPVTADDFVYGWRRAIEPGTAHVYSFLIAENIAGAKEYQNWRNRAVRVLGILRDKAQGKDIKREDEEFFKQLNLPGSKEQNPDWNSIAKRFREEHLGQMEKKFARVGIKALDERHLEVKLVRPTAYFLDLAAFPTFMPIHKKSIELLRKTDPSVSDLTLWVFDPQWVKCDYHHKGYPGLISNGAFMLADWQFKRYMLLNKNPYYWDRENVKSETFMARVIPEASTSFLAYERGDLDWIDDLTRLDFAPALVEKMRRGERTDIHHSLAFGTYFYYFNCEKKLPDGSKNPFHLARVRMAFNLAVDKKAIYEKVRKVGTPVALNFVPPKAIKGYYCPPGPEYNPKRARQLLAAAGYPEGKGLPTIEILYNQGYGHEDVAEAISQMWESQLQVEVIIRGKEIKSFDEDKTNHNFMVCRASWFGDYGDPTTFLDMMITGNGQNDAGFSYEPYDKLMAQAGRCLDEHKRLEILAEAEKMLVQEQMPFLPIYYYVNLAAFREDVKGIYLNPRKMYPFKYIYKEK